MSRVGGRAGLIGDSWSQDRPNPVQLEADVVNPAVPPGFAQLEAPDERMFRVSKIMATGVMVWRLVAACDGPTRMTHPQVHPG